jgi:predicted aldo/keto reductase-like oxidoreductase
LPWFETTEPFFRFALSQPITTAVIGCDDVEQLEENVRLAGSFSPMTETEAQELIRNVSSFARELMYYKP